MVAALVARALAVDRLVQRVVAREAVPRAARRLCVIVGVREEQRGRHRRVVRRAGAREAAQHARHAAAEVRARVGAERPRAGVRVDAAGAQREQLAIAAQLGEPAQRAHDGGLHAREPGDAGDREDRGAHHVGEAAAAGPAVEEVEAHGGGLRLDRVRGEQLLGGAGEAGGIAARERGRDGGRHERARQLLGAVGGDAHEREARHVAHVGRGARGARDLGERGQRGGGAAADERGEDRVLPLLGGETGCRACVEQLEERGLGGAQVAVGDLPDRGPEGAIAAGGAVAALQALDELAARIGRPGDHDDGAGPGGRAGAAEAIGGLAVAAGLLLGDELVEQRARLDERQRRGRLRAVAQRAAAPAEAEVHDVVAARDLDEIDLVDLVGRALAKLQARLIDHPHVASLQRRRDLPFRSTRHSCGRAASRPGQRRRASQASSVPYRSTARSSCA